MRRLFPIVLLFLAARAFAQTTVPFDSTRLMPTLTFSENYNEMLTGSGVVMNPRISSLTISAAASAAGIDLTQIDATTPFSITVGNFSYSGTLGDDPNFDASTGVSHVPLNDFDADGTPVVSGTITVTWSTRFNTIGINVSAPRVDLRFVDAMNYAGVAGPINDILTADFSFADHELTAPDPNSGAALNGMLYAVGNSTVTEKDVTSGTSPPPGAYFLSSISVVGRIDSIRPTVAITLPKANATVFDPTITLSGSAGDATGQAAALTGTAQIPGGISAVYVSVNGGDYMPANGDGNSAANWSLDIDLMPGTNTVRVYSVDLSGNPSLVVTRSFKYSLLSNLTVAVSGSGTASAGFLGTVKSGTSKTLLIETGENYTLTAKPAAGWLFDSWSGDVSSLLPKITFQQTPDTSITAHFVPNPFRNLAGTYSGLVDPGGDDPEAAGFFTVTIGKTGGLSGKLTLDGKTYAFHGPMSGHGFFPATFPRHGTTPLTLALWLDTSGSSKQITGTVGDGVFLSNITGDLATYDGKKTIAPELGAYTVLIPADPATGGSNAAAFPQGTGYGTLKIDKTGRGRIAAALGDNTKISFTSTISKDHKLPVYASLYSHTGALFGAIGFGTANLNPNADASGTMDWIKPAKNHDPLYAGGFLAHPQLVASKYAAPPSGASAIQLSNGMLIFQSPLFSGTQNVSLGSANSLAMAPPLNFPITGKISRASGLFSGLFKNTPHTWLPYHGAVFQKTNTGAGLFVNGSQTGGVTLQ